MPCILITHPWCQQIIYSIITQRYNWGGKALKYIFHSISYLFCSKRHFLFEHVFRFGHIPKKLAMYGLKSMERYTVHLRMVIIILADVTHWYSRAIKLWTAFLCFISVHQVHQGVRVRTTASSTLGEIKILHGTGVTHSFLLRPPILGLSCSGSPMELDPHGTSTQRENLWSKAGGGSYQAHPISRGHRRAGIGGWQKYTAALWSYTAGGQNIICLEEPVCGGCQWRDILQECFWKVSHLQSSSSTFNQM